jgi:hypothetical protein
MASIAVLDNIKLYILKPFIAFLLVLALVYFLYGLYKFIAGYDNETARTEGKSHMVWGVVGMAIMVSVYGLLSIVKETISVIAN